MGDINSNSGLFHAEAWHMTDIFLDRFKSDGNGTFGELSDALGDLQHIYTIERPPTGAHPCIPAGVYDIEQYQSPKHGDIWQVMNVPNRSNIEIHPANTMDDLLGCIGVGDSLGKVNDLPAVLNSQKTFSMLKLALPASFRLTISG